MRHSISETNRSANTSGDDTNAGKFANDCPDFRLDCEDECVSEDAVNCLNCRYRRWTRENFDCLKGKR